MKVVMLGVDLDEELAQRVRDEEAPKRVTRIPGIGVLTATALVAAAGINQSVSKCTARRQYLSDGFGRKNCFSGSFCSWRMDFQSIKMSNYLWTD